MHNKVSADRHISSPSAGDFPASTAGLPPPMYGDRQVTAGGLVFALVAGSTRLVRGGRR